MSRCALFVIGPAGTGKTTFCATLLEHYASEKRNAYYVNLDPAVQQSAVSETGHASIMDIREKYPLEPIMTTHDLGPNGGLLLCLEKFAADHDYLDDKLTGFHRDEFLIIDCPGQIETFLHEEAIPKIIQKFQEKDYIVGAAFLLDATFLQDEDNTNTNNNKLLSGMLNSLAAMLQLNISSINILTKMDLVGGIDSWDADVIETMLDLDENPYADSAVEDTFSTCVKRILSTYGMSQLLPLDVTDRTSVATIAYQIDYLLQNDEGHDVNQDKNFEEEDEMDEDW